MADGFGGMVVLGGIIAAAIGNRRQILFWRARILDICLRHNI